MAERVITESTKVFQKEMKVFIPVRTLRVLNSNGSIIGSAQLEWCEHGANIRFFLDPHHPESLDLEIEPTRTKIRLMGQIDGEGFSGWVTIE